MQLKSAVFVLVILICISFSISGSYSVHHPLSGSTGNGDAHASAASASSSILPNLSLFSPAGKQKLVSSLINSFKKHNIPMRYWTLPSLDPQVGEPYSLMHPPLTGPGYTHTPAPMGIADYGFQNTSGIPEQNILYTDGLSGYVNLTQMNVLYLDPYGSQGFSVQLNAFLNNVTLLGQSKYRFWTQNVIYYYKNTKTLILIDFIDDFSTSKLPTNNWVYKHGPDLGQLTSSYYFGYLEYLTNVSVPFNISLSMNSYLSYHGNDNLSMNYSIAYVNSSTGEWNHNGGEFDYIDFNSTYGMPSGYRAPVSLYKIDQSSDAELIVGGPGGGSTTDVTSISGKMSLYYYNMTVNRSEYVPDAFSAGSETGETLSGVSEYYTTPGTVYLTSGPSIIEPLWNTSGGVKNSGFITVSGRINETAAFIFFQKEGMASTLSWAPLPLSGIFSYELMPADYEMSAVLSYYTPFSENIVVNVSGLVINLKFNLSEGIYTPFYALSNQQLASLALSGNGSYSNPYMVPGYSDTLVSFGGKTYFVPKAHMLQRFSDFNDYIWPVFYGLFIYNTSQYAVFDNLPSFNVSYASYYTEFGFSLSQYFGLPSYNNLMYNVYYSSNLTLAHLNRVEGLLTVYYPVLANMNIYDSRNVLIASNDFYSSGISLLLYSSSNATRMNDTVWGNYFYLDYNLLVISSKTNETSPYLSLVDQASDPQGVDVYSSGNLIYNNYFATTDPAFSPSDVYNPIQINYYEVLKQVNYTDSWNISRTSSSYARVVNDFVLSGSIIPVGYQGGNYWSNYFGNGTYNNTGMIQSGADGVPLTWGMHRVTFSVSGVAAGTNVTVSIQNPLEIPGTVDIMTSSQVTGSGDVSFLLQNGTYTYTVSKVPGYYLRISSGTFAVDGLNLSINVTYSTVKYSATFNVSFLPEGLSWFVNISGAPSGSISTDSYTAYLPNGSYTFTVADSSPLYRPDITQGLFVINNTSYYFQIQFYEVTIPVSFQEFGLSSLIRWSVIVDGSIYSTSSQTLNLLLPNGTYSYEFTNASTYHVVGPSSGTFILNGTPRIIVAHYSVNMFSVTFVESGLPSGKEWSLYFNGTKMTVSAPSITVMVPDGAYSFNISNVSGFRPSVVSSTVTVNNTSVIVTLSFTRILTVPARSSNALLYGLVALAAAIVVAVALITLRRRN